MTVECAAAAPSALQTLAPLGSWILVIAGWYVVSKGHNKREARKEIKATLDGAVARSERIAELAQDYYASDPGFENAKRAGRIRSELKTLATEVHILRSASEAKIDANHALIALRQAITGGEFDSSNRAAEPPESEVFAEIDEAVVAFHRRLTVSFTQFPR